MTWGRWLGGVALDAASRGEYVVIETGGWEAVNEPYVLLGVFPGQAQAWLSVVEAAPAPTDPPWTAPAAGSTGSSVSAPATFETVSVAGLVAIQAVEIWARTPLDVVLTFGQHPHGPWAPESRPAHGTRDLIRATYPCAKCSGTTGSVALSRAHQRIPIPETVKGVPPGVDMLAGELGWASVTLEEFGSFALVDAEEKVVDKYESAIRAGSARTLYELNVEACPYWCPTCSATYCRSCWKIDPRTTPDNFYATCPAGHLRKLWGD